MPTARAAKTAARQPGFISAAGGSVLTGGLGKIQQRPLQDSAKHPKPTSSNWVAVIELKLSSHNPEAVIYYISILW